MILSLIAFIVIAATAYVWVIRGFLSALLNMACTIAAGAIAFGVWEHAAYFLLTKAPTRGFFDFLESSAWALGLILPFVASLAVLRLVTDKFVPANAQADTAVDYAGGGICGLISGIITAGVIAISAGTLRTTADSLGYQPVNYSGQSIKRTGGLLLPVDRIVGSLYTHTSTNALASSTPLARWRPEPWHASEVLRMNEGGGKARNTARPADFSVIGRYTVEADSVAALLKDKWAERDHAAAMLDGSPYPDGSRLEGIIIEFASGMREKEGFVSITEAQLWMIAENDSTGESLNLHPVAVVANPKGAETALMRWPFDTKLSVASSGASVRPMAFEFCVPSGFDPLAIYVKNIRKSLSGEAREFSSPLARDRAIEDGSLIEGSTALDPSLTTAADRPNTQPGSGNDIDEARAMGFNVSNSTGRVVIQKGREKGLEIGDGNKIINGEGKWGPKELAAGGIDQQLRINLFQVNKDVVMVQVDVSTQSKSSLLGKAAAAAERLVPPVVIDSNGQRYEAVGWIYQDRDMTYIRYTPGQPIRGLQELQDQRVELSTSRDDQKLTLLFLCSFDSRVDTFAIGGKVVTKLEKPIHLKNRQK